MLWAGLWPGWSPVEWSEVSWARRLDWFEWRCLVVGFMGAGVGIRTGIGIGTAIGTVMGL